MFKLGDEHESDDNEKPNSALQMVFKTNTNRANRIALWALLLEIET